MVLPAVAQGLTATAVAASTSPAPRREGVVVLAVIFGCRWADLRMSMGDSAQCEPSPYFGVGVDRTHFGSSDRRLTPRIG
jgi:hypothetical protein